MNVKDRPYNQPCWEVGRRKSDWRMRSASVEGEDTTTSPERGPLGPGGTVAAKFPHFEAGALSGQGFSEGSGKPEGEVRNVRIRLNSHHTPGRPAAELIGAWCWKPYWGKPTVRNFREGGWKRGHGKRTEAQHESVGNATAPYRARASVLPDGEQTPVRTQWREARHREHGTVVGRYDECLEIREAYSRNNNG
jgi:hypothetical protein